MANCLMIDLNGKVAIVTGAGMGVGKGIALALADAGADVVCNSRTQSDLDATVAEIERRGQRGLSVIGDVLEADTMDRLVSATLEAFGRIDIVVNNAGGCEFNGLMDISDDEFEYHFDWNTKSAFMLSRRAAQHMINQGDGVIVNISSAVGHLTARGMMAYGVAKAGLDYLTKGLADELAPSVRVISIALGSIMTPGLESLLEREPEYGINLIAKTPLRKIGDTRKVGETVAFLCSPSADYITGCVLNFDGGLQDTNLPYRLPDIQPTGS